MVSREYKSMDDEFFVSRHVADMESDKMLLIAGEKLILITLVRKNGHEVIGVLLGSGDRRDEAREILDYSFNKLK